MRIAKGATRIVLLTTNYAIKLPRLKEWRLFLHGLLANMQEEAFSKTKWPECCPVLFYVPGGFLVIMPRCRVMSQEEFHTFDYNHFIYRPEYKVPAEKKPDSFGWLNGKVVAIDYGS